MEYSHIKNAIKSCKKINLNRKNKWKWNENRE